ncbi:MAG TPA: preprotein translocase subunit SecG [Planctomycetota bacterium]|nr:preprotein translocase subunit SecG [Planctomycetota bacterium]
MKELFLTLLWIVFITDSLLLVLIVLLQSGRGGGLSGMLGGGGGAAESALGPRTGLPRITGIMATIFFVTAIFISAMTRPRQIMDPGRPKDSGAAVEGTGTPDTKATPDTPEGQPKDGAPKPPDASKATTATPAGPKATTATAPASKATTGTPAAPKAAPATSTAPRTTP